MLESAIGFEHLVGETITTTPTHPFYVPQKGWTEAAKLRAGDILVTCNGEYVVVELVQHELLETPITVYNFEVEDFHTYYVAANEDTEFVLVHNECGPSSSVKSMQKGQEVHKKWNYGQNDKTFKKEVTIPGAGRADAVDFTNRIVYELKPNNARAIRAGWRQLNKYAGALEKTYGGSWIKILITYKN